MKPRSNVVPYPPAGLIVAIQYWSGDEADAMRLARLLADVEPRRRDDVTLALCRRFDTALSALAWDTSLHCGKKFGVSLIRSEREGVGHPAGANDLWAGTMDQFAAAWRDGSLRSSVVFTVEADGVPLRADWLDILLAEHALAEREGKRITGPLMEHPVRHINGTLVASLSMWVDRPSLHRTPSEHAWDLYHAGVLMAEARPTSLVKNIYGAREWSPVSLAAVARETAWLASTKDESAIRWAEAALTQRPTLCRKCGEAFAVKACSEYHGAIQRKETQMPTKEPHEAKPETFVCPHCREPASAHTMDNGGAGGAPRLYCPPARDEKPTADGRRVFVQG